MNPTVPLPDFTTEHGNRGRLQNDTGANNASAYAPRDDSDRLLGECTASPYIGCAIAFLPSIKISSELLGTVSFMLSPSFIRS